MNGPNVDGNDGEKVKEHGRSDRSRKRHISGLIVIISVLIAVALIAVLFCISIDKGSAYGINGLADGEQLNYNVTMISGNYTIHGTQELILSNVTSDHMSVKIIMCLPGKNSSVSENYDWTDNGMQITYNNGTAISSSPSTDMGTMSMSTVYGQRSVEEVSLVVNGMNVTNWMDRTTGMSYKTVIQTTDPSTTITMVLTSTNIPSME